MANPTPVPSMSRLPKAFAWVFLLLGVYDFADWLYAGHADYDKALKGLGFLLMAVGSFADAYPAYAASLKINGRGNLLRLLPWVGVVLVCAGFLFRWL